MPGPLSATSTTTPSPSSKLRTVTTLRFAVGLVQRLRRVEEQVQEHLPEPRRAGPHQARRAQVALDAGPVLELVAQHRERRLQRRVDVHGDAGVVVGVGERAEVAHDAVNPRHPLLRLLQDRGRLEQHVREAQAPERRLGQLAQLVLDQAQVPGQRLDVRQHERRGVVDLVRHAGRQQADRRQLLGLQAPDLLRPARRSRRARRAARPAPTAGKRAPRRPARPGSGRDWRSGSAPPPPAPPPPGPPVARRDRDARRRAFATWRRPSGPRRQTPSSKTSKVSRRTSPSARRPEDASITGDIRTRS